MKRLQKILEFMSARHAIENELLDLADAKAETNGMAVADIVQNTVNIRKLSKATDEEIKTAIEQLKKLKKEKQWNA
jgi:hypothetical protein